MTPSDTTSNAANTVSISDISAQIRAREHAAYEREVDVSVSRGLAQANDPDSPKHTLEDMHTQVSKTIARVAKVSAHA